MQHFGTFNALAGNYSWWIYALVKAFENAIARLLKDSQLRREMGHAAQSYVRQEHDLNRNYQKMVATLQEIVDK